MASLIQEDMGDTPLYIFGYGSLLWNPNINFTSSSPCCVPGFIRRLYQSSPDHRGSPERMGRVATLIPVSRQPTFSALLPAVDPHTRLALSSWLGGSDAITSGTGGSSTAPIGSGASQQQEEEEEEALLPGEVPVVHGIAYLLDSSSRREMLEKLAVREVAGYEPVKLSATLPSGESLPVYTFIGRVGGEHWAPERNMDTLAGIVASAIGPSGSNAEYACRLLASSRTLSSSPDVWLESLLLTLRHSHPHCILPSFGL